MDSPATPPPASPTPAPLPAGGPPPVLMIDLGAIVLGLLRVLLGILLLPLNLIQGAIEELAVWGREWRLPDAQSDVPVLTFLVVCLRSFALVVFPLLSLLFALLALFGTGPFYPAGLWGGWRAGPALGGFFGGIFIGYFGIIGLSLVFEGWSLLVRLANHVREIAERR